MEILLHDDVTASGKCGVLFSDERGFDSLLPLGILRPIRQHAGQAAAKAVKSRRADEPAQVSTEMSDCRPILHAWMNRNHEEDCRAGQGGGDGLWDRFLVGHALPPRSIS